MKVLIFILLFLCSIIVHAQIKEVNLDLLKEESTDIIIAKVNKIDSYIRSKGRTYSDITLEIQQNIKGKLKSKDKITLTYYGGTVNGITTLVMESPGFLQEEESVFFLKEYVSKKSPRIYYKISLGKEGKFDISTDKMKEKIVCREKFTSPLKINSKTSQTLFENNHPMKLNDFIKLVK